MGSEHLFQRYRLLGVDYSCAGVDQLAEWLAREARNGLAGYVCIANVHTATLAWIDRDFRDRQRASLLSVPDGMPLVWAGRVLGEPAARAYGADLMWRTIDIGRQSGVRHLLLGGDEALLAALVGRVERGLPGARIVGAVAPPVMDAEDPRWASVWEQVQRASPDLTWVGLGAPKQEILMSQYSAGVPGIKIGVGQAFAINAGATPRPPSFLQRLGLEWAYRLARDPARLGRRYLLHNALFLLGAPFDLAGQLIRRTIAQR